MLPHKIFREGCELVLQIYTLVAFPKGQNHSRDVPGAQLSILHCLLNIFLMIRKTTLEYGAEQKNKTPMDPEDISP